MLWKTNLSVGKMIGFVDPLCVRPRCTNESLFHSIRCFINVNTTSISTLSSIAALAATLLPVGAFLLVWFRTGSLHLPLSRVWQLILGTQEIQDPEIKKMISDQNDLMRFRLAFGINSKSINQCHQLREWAIARGVEMKDVGACGALFELQALDLKKKLPSSTQVGFSFAVMLFAVWLLIVLTALLPNERVLLKFKGTGRWFLLESTVAQPLSRAPALTRDACSSDEDKETKGSFSLDERKIICEAFAKGVGGPKSKNSETNSSKLSDYLRGALSSQRLLLTSLMIVVGVVTAFLVRYLRAAEAAKKLKGILDSHAKSVGGTSIDGTEAILARVDG